MNKKSIFKDGANKNLTHPKNNKGITLIALVITIIVLLILAGVTINMVLGDDGIIKQAQVAKQAQEDESALEQIKLAEASSRTKGLGKVDDDLLENELKKAFGENGYTKTGDATNGWTITVGDVSYVIKGTGTGNVITEELKVTDVQETVLSEDENTPVKDDYGNIIIVPAGFMITEDADTVPEGIVIEDVSAGTDTQGSQFVWIPVGDVYTTTDEEKTSENTKVVTLGRYEEWGSTGTPVQKVTTEAEAISAASATIPVHSDYYEVTPDNTTYPQSSYPNARAKNLEGFLKSAVKNGGYYIARYEAGINGTKDNYTLSQEGKTTALTVKPQSKQGLGVWNHIKQTDASKVSQAMYTNNNFTSDLINSYAWDTAIIFIQKMSGKDDYANQSSLNIGEPITTGSSGDVQYNIYDMASNVQEWSTEIYDSEDFVVPRGDACYDSCYSTSTRYCSGGSEASEGFRTIVYFGRD